ncbi:hypothetical protein D3C80_1586400 [compost metagenome]
MLFFNGTEGNMLPAHTFPGDCICVHCTASQLRTGHRSVREFGCRYAMRKQVLSIDRVMCKHFAAYRASSQMASQYGTGLQLL